MFFSLVEATSFISELIPTMLPITRDFADVRNGSPPRRNCADRRQGQCDPPPRWTGRGVGANRDSLGDI